MKEGCIRGLEQNSPALVGLCQGLLPVTRFGVFSSVALMRPLVVVAI